jgi:hypothetical protein
VMVTVVGVILRLRLLLQERVEIGIIKMGLVRDHQMDTTQTTTPIPIIQISRFLVPRHIHRCQKCYNNPPSHHPLGNPPQQ